MAMVPPAPPVPPDEPLVTLVYELLDAHRDTAQLAGGSLCQTEWRAHLEYLRALQRRGREMLAAASVAQRL
jgi:hypothetical protein